MTVTKEWDVSSWWDLKDMVWSGALDTLNQAEKVGKEDEVLALLEEMFPEPVDETELNDFIWFSLEDYIDLYNEDNEDDYDEDDEDDYDDIEEDEE